MGIEIALGTVGSFTAGLVGVTGLSMATTVVIGGAIVGAAIGGLTAALTDGDIGKGMLFGAIGGAVAGGVVNLAGGTGAVSGVTGGLESGGMASANFIEAASGSGSILTEGGLSSSSGILAGESLGSVGTVGATTSAGVLDSIGAQVGIGALTTGVKSYLAAGMAEDQAKANSENWEKRLEAQKLAGEQAMEQLRYQRENLSEQDKLAANLRTSELEQRKIEFAENLTLQRDQFDFQTEARANRQALFDERSRRGDGAQDTLATTGIYDYLQTKPTGSALAPPEEERQVA